MTMLLQKLLEMESDEFFVEVASSGEEAIELSKENPPHLFMVDYHLVDMDGLELVQYLREQPEFSQTPIIMASGLDVRREALNMGADVFLLKPFEPGDLAGIMIELIGH